MNNFSTLFLPSLAKGLPTDSLEKTIAERALRRFWHSTFDPCPRLRTIYGVNSNTLFEEFIEWAFHHDYTFTWTLPLHLLLWLESNTKYKNCLAEQDLKELIIAAAKKWYKQDLSDSRKIVITTYHLPNYFITGIKPQTLDERYRLYWSKSSSSSLNIELGYFCSTNSTINLDGEWLVPPK